MAQPRKQVVDGLDDNPGPIAILDVGGMDRDTHQQARRVGHNMALATFDFFRRIIPSWSTAFGGLDRLAVDDASRWTGLAAEWQFRDCGMRSHIRGTAPAAASSSIHHIP